MRAAAFGQEQPLRPVGDGAISSDIESFQTAAEKEPQCVSRPLRA